MGGQWTGHRFVQIPFQPRHCHFCGNPEFRWKRVTRQGIVEFGATVRCVQVAARSRTGNADRPSLIVAECESKNASGSLRMEQRESIEEAR